MKKFKRYSKGDKRYLAYQIAPRDVIRVLPEANPRVQHKVIPIRGTHEIRVEGHSPMFFYSKAKKVENILVGDYLVSTSKGIVHYSNQKFNKLVGI